MGCCREPSRRRGSMPPAGSRSTARPSSGESGFSWRFSATVCVAISPRRGHCWISRTTCSLPSCQRVTCSTTREACIACMTSWSPSAIARRSTAHIGREIPTASFTCGHWKMSWRCSLTVRMLSPRQWPSPSAARPSTCRARMQERYPPGSLYHAQAVRRLDDELRLIEHHKLSGFFLVYHDLFDLAREVAADIRRGSRRALGNLLPGRGRGSSVSSIVCYLLGLSHIDPIANHLFLGRFLNESLASVPDIDLDFPREIREELIRRVYKRYGDEHVGLVCSFPTYRLRSAVREIGKALDLPPGEIEQVAKLADRRSGGLADELDQLPGFAGRRNAPLWKELCELAEEIAGLPRHVSQHVGGMIISSRPLVEIVPLERAAMEDRVVCQWDKDSCDDARFVKIDFLALGMLSLVEECVERIAVREGKPPDLSRIDFEDAAVYDRICRGDTVGLFQIESRAQIQMIRRTRPKNLEDLAVEVAIVRPGPIVGGAVNPYVRRREDQRRARAAGRAYEPPLEHPLLKDALAETLGVILYQDQVLQVCQALAGFSAGQAEALRRAMSRRRSR